MTSRWLSSSVPMSISRSLRLRVVAVEPLDRVLHGRGQLAVGAAELLQQHAAEPRVGLADADGVHQLLDVVIHQRPPCSKERGKTNRSNVQIRCPVSATAHRRPGCLRRICPLRPAATPTRGHRAIPLMERRHRVSSPRATARGTLSRIYLSLQCAAGSGLRCPRSQPRMSNHKSGGNLIQGEAECTTSDGPDRAPSWSRSPARLCLWPCRSVSRPATGGGRRAQRRAADHRDAGRRL